MAHQWTHEPKTNYHPARWRSGTLLVWKSSGRGGRWYLSRKARIGEQHDTTLGSYATKAEAMADAETLSNPPKRLTKTVDVFLPMPRAEAVKWLRARAIPFTHMREHARGVAFRIRRGYLLDFQHEKDKSAPYYTNARKRAVRQATRRRRRANPVKPWDRGQKFGVTLRSLHVRYFQGYAEDVRYTRAEDGKPYSHVVETDAAELYLCEDPTYGKCLLIVDPSGKTPLWG